MPQTRPLLFAALAGLHAGGQAARPRLSSPISPSPALSLSLGISSSPISPNPTAPPHGGVPAAGALPPSLTSSRPFSYRAGKPFSYLLVPHADSPAPSSSRVLSPSFSMVELHPSLLATISHGPSGSSPPGHPPNSLPTRAERRRPSPTPLPGDHARRPRRPV
jgi:hypothetical protein